jgi:hypothetical protein
MIPRLAPDNLLARTIEEVIQQLEEVIVRSIRDGSRLGFFAALYHKVTIKVKEGIEAGQFEDGPRMERLDVTFANRYLNALDQFVLGEKATPCWMLAFDAANRWAPIILQHLLLGMNAHINFDLGIAAAQTCPGDQLPSLKRDFDQINVILGSLVAQVEAEVGEVSPWINLLDHIGGRTEQAIIEFSMQKARDAAWGLAQTLAALSPEQWQPELDRRDREMTRLGRLVLNPGWLLNLGLLVIRLRESNDIPKIIQVVSSQ